MFKITALQNAYDAALAVVSTDESFQADEARIEAARLALRAEWDLVDALKAEYNAMPETAGWSGWTNACDTYPTDANREQSSEFWLCARDSLQCARDFGDVTTCL